MEVRNVLEDIAHSLVMFSPQRIEEPIKMSLPYNLYRQFMERLSSDTIYYHGIIKGAVRFNTSSGVSFILTCKEIDIENINSYITTYFNDIY